GIRTPNLLIRSQMLYPLSYERRWAVADPLYWTAVAANPGSAGPVAGQVGSSKRDQGTRRPGDDEQMSEPMTTAREIMRTV
ncbi:MAG: hypothetical protein JWP02_3616, partial [Acidimicrobiales bacterium]|nr:hypothetical protein [Acidimicrobiales bacterium]